MHHLINAFVFATVKDPVIVAGYLAGTAFACRK